MRSTRASRVPTGAPAGRFEHVKPSQTVQILRASQKPAAHGIKVWFDDVVVATASIGPMRPR